MSVYIIRAAFNVVIVFKLLVNLSPYTMKLLQDIFYMVWDLPIVLPPLVMHFYNYRPQFNVTKN